VIPFTLHITALSFELETVAANASVRPSNTVPALGVKLMVMEGGGGDVGATEPAPPPPQPRVHALIARSTIVSTHWCAAGEFFFVTPLVSRICGRGCMPTRMQNKSHLKI
jgi:hypothetical protein